MVAETTTRSHNVVARRIPASNRLVNILDTITNGKDTFDGSSKTIDLIVIVSNCTPINRHTERIRQAARLTSRDK